MNLNVSSIMVTMMKLGGTLPLKVLMMKLVVLTTMTKLGIPPTNVVPMNLVGLPIQVMVIKLGVPPTRVVLMKLDVIRAQ